MADAELPDPKLARLAEVCPELRDLPRGWTYDVTKDRRIFYRKPDGDTTYIHPKLGELPSPWILKLIKQDNSLVVAYYNRDENWSSSHDPRFMDKTIQKHSRKAPQGLSAAARMIKNRINMDISTGRWMREPISKENIRHKFEIIHTIDAGDGKLGGMNGGVFVVRMKGVNNSLYVEKRFKKADVAFGTKEIKMLHRVKHTSLTFYIAAFILPDLSDASIYVEFCDRGSLEDVIKQYVAHSDDHPRLIVPEGFIWHAFIGLCEGLAYLEGGKAYWRKGDDLQPVEGWIPILHRDVKPDNVLLRSRSTLGSSKYFYCVLSDFGLACEHRDDRDPLVDQWQHAGLKLGTKSYWAPELLYNPYPRANPWIQQDQFKYFPTNSMHTKRSDLWAVGASMYNLCNISPSNFGMAHIDLRGHREPVKLEHYMEGTASRVRTLDAPNIYTKQLREAINTASRWELEKRPSPIKMVKVLEQLVDDSGFDKNQGKSEPLPDWATRVHEYHSKAEKLSKVRTAPAGL